MQKISILFLAFIGLIAIQWNGVQADNDQGNYEEGKTFVLPESAFCDCLQN